MGYKARFVDDVIVPIVSGVSAIGLATGMGLILSGTAQYNDALQTRETVAKVYACENDSFKDHLKKVCSDLNIEFQEDKITADAMVEKISAESSVNGIINHLKQNPNVSNNEHKNVDELEKTINDSEHRTLAGGNVALSSLATMGGMAITSYVINKRIKKRENEREM